MPDAATAAVLRSLQAPPGPQASLLQTVVFVVAIAAIMYFVIYRPQEQERKAHGELVASLAKDDRVVTAAGIHGKVVEVSGDTIVLEVADKTRLTFDKAAIARKVEKPAPAEKTPAEKK